MDTTDRAFKVLVCITPQTNSKRLIDRGHEIASEKNAELHILHAEIGNSIFLTDDAPQLLESLFQYGSGLKGIVHGICGTDISKVIRGFIRKHQITDVVLGASPPDASAESVHSKLKTAMPHIQITILERADKAPERE